jgi:hypothetical protein
MYVVQRKLTGACRTRSPMRGDTSSNVLARGDEISNFPIWLRSGYLIQFGQAVLGPRGENLSITVDWQLTYHLVLIEVKECGYGGNSKRINQPHLRLLFRHARG